LTYILPSPGKFTLWAILSISILNYSCSDPATVGLELAPGNNQIGVFFQEFELPAKVVLLDSFETTTNPVRRGILLAGHEQDAFFGITEAKSYSRLSFNQSATRPTNEAFYDSATFSIDVISVNGVDLDKKKFYSVHRLEEPILDTAYYNFDKLRFNPLPIASGEILFGDVKDTTIQIKVAPDFAFEIFDLLVKGRVFKDLFTFRDYLPGIAIKSRTGDNTTIGFQQGQNTGFTFYYHFAGDTVPTSYRITTSSSTGFVGIESNRLGTPTQKVVDYGVAYDVGDKVGVKSNLGMVLKIDTSPFDQFLDTLAGVTFNQVEFEIGEIESYPETQNPLFSGYLYLTNQSNKFIRRSTDKNPITVQISGQPQVELDANGNPIPSIRAPSRLTFNNNTGVYKVDISSYTNAIYKNTLIREDWLFYGGLVVNGSDDDDFKKSLRQFVVDKNKVKVKLIYSKIR
jgi:hypothetical protein